MSDEEFLARWSRRKRKARATVDAPATIEPAETPDPAPSATAENAADAELDLSSLPPVESITAATDITAFLRQGIPQDLSRAALRRAWAADPAIRDFVGLAENAWDFNDPTAMPGFSALPPDYDIKKVLAQMFGDDERPAAAEALTQLPADTAEVPVAEENAPRPAATESTSPVQS